LEILEIRKVFLAVSALKSLVLIQKSGTFSIFNQALMAEYEKRVRELLLQNGCTFLRRGKGDHDIWYSPITQRHVTVDGKIRSRHTANGVLKQCGIDFKF